MKVQKISLIVLIFTCATCLILSSETYACWTNLPDPQYECGFRCCTTPPSCPSPGGRYECPARDDCKLNLYCLLHPIYCFIQAIRPCYGYSDRRDVLSEMRDGRIARTAFGRSLIKLYYKHSLEITSIMISDEELLSFVTPVVSEVAEKAIAFNNYEKVTVDREFVDGMLAIADLINEKASPELGTDINKIKKQIKSGYIFRRFGITVED